MVFTWSLPDRGLSHGWRLSTSWLLAPSRSGVEARLRATCCARCRRGGQRERRSWDYSPPLRSSSRPLPPPPRLSSPASRPGRVLGAGAPRSLARSPLPPRPKSSPAPPNTTGARNQPSLGTHTCAACHCVLSYPHKCSTSALSCPRCTPRPRPRRPPCIFCRRSIVPRCRRGGYVYKSVCGRGASGHAGKLHHSTWSCI